MATTEDTKALNATEMAATPGPAPSDTEAPPPRKRLPESPLSPGERIDQYQVIRQIGVGGMGWVYLCRDTLLGRKAALKVIRPDRVDAAGGIDALLLEAKATATFSHPHIVTIYGFGFAQGSPYVAFEFLEGQNLRERMREGDISTPHALRILEAIAAGLAEAHAAAIVHRDIKPENVFLPQDGRLRVLDFGLAQDAPKEGNKQANAVVAGTRGYIAPEIWDGETSTPAVDIWALGIIFIELFCGARPKDRLPSGEALRKVLTESAADLPLAAVDLLLSCLKHHPEDRPSAKDIAEGLQRILQRRRRPSGMAGPPFRGLLPFLREHSRTFFGRDKEISAFIGRIRESALLAVVGPPGVGKSSFVQAGALPQLEDQGPWLSLILRPGTDPLATLAQTLTRKSSVTLVTRSTDNALGSEGQSSFDEAALKAQLLKHPAVAGAILREMAEANHQRIVLAIDQFEELYTQETPVEEQTAFLQALLGIADDPNGPLRVVVTMRDDFLVHVAEYAPLAREVERGIFLLRVPRPDDLAEILEQTANLASYQFEDPGLVAEMVREVEGEVAALPLLQFAAQRMWELRDPQRKVLLRESYDKIGGVGGALADHAEKLLEELPSPQLNLVRMALLRLITPEGTRALVSYEELANELGPGGANIIQRLIQARLLLSRQGDSAEGGSVELVHESLIHRWQRLQRWLETSRQDIQLQNFLLANAKQWAHGGRRNGDLLRGESLLDALSWKERREVQLVEPLKTFLFNSQQHSQRLQKRRRRLVAAVVVGSLAISFLSVAAAFWMRNQRRIAQASQHRATKSKASAERSLANSLVEAARADYARADMVAARAKLRRSLEIEDSLLGRNLWWQLSANPLYWWKRIDPVYAVAFSPKGDRVVAAGRDKAAYSFHVHNPKSTKLDVALGTILNVSYAPSGNMLAMGTYGGLVVLHDLRSGEQTHLKGHEGPVWDVAFGKKGEVVASAGRDQTIRLWRVKDGELITKLEGHKAQITNVDFSAKGDLLLSSGWDQTARIWDWARGKELKVLRGHRELLLDARFSPDSTLIATAGGRQIHFWGWPSGKRQHVLDGHTDHVSSLSFSAKGNRLASGSWDGSIRLWDVAKRKTLSIYQNGDRVHEVAFAPQGQLLASAGDSQGIRLWQTGRATVSGAPYPASKKIAAVTVDKEAKHIATGHWDNSVRVWRKERREAISVLKGHRGWVTSLAIHPNKAVLASGSWDQSIRIWNMQTNTAVQTLWGHNGRLQALVYAGDTLISAGVDGTIRFWEGAENSQAKRLKAHTGPINAIALHRPSKRLASCSDDGSIAIWSIAKRRLIRRIDTKGNAAVEVAWSDRGELISAHRNRSIQLWKANGRSSQQIALASAKINGLQIDASGSRIGAALADGTIVFWSMDGSLKMRLQGHRRGVNDLSLATSRGLLATVSDDQTLRLWTIADGRALWRSPPVVLAGQAPADGTNGWARIVSKEATRLATTDTGPLVCAANNRQIELWDSKKNRRIRKIALDGSPKQLVNLDTGCASLNKGRIVIYGPGKRTTKVATDARAIARVGQDLWIARRIGDGIDVHDNKGTFKRRLDYFGEISAIAGRAGSTAIGFEDGTLEIRRKGGAQSFLFEGTSPAPVTSLLFGPKETLIAGFADGLVGVWDSNDGLLLRSSRLHGAVEWLAYEDKALLATSEVGDQRRIDLQVLGKDYCAILKGVRHNIPLVWRDGEARSPVAQDLRSCNTKLSRAKSQRNAQMGKAKR
jgi:WD40 repeat protein/serine/threonine protein kinase